MAALGESIQSASDECFEFVCAPCSEENEIVEAITFCVECGYMCKKCLQYHNRFKHMREHTMFDRQAMRGQGLQTPLSVPTERCDKHNGRLLDTYCGQHDEICCGTCISLNHRLCTGIEYLPYVSQGIASTEEFQTLVASMTSLNVELRSLKKKREEDAARLLEDHQKAMDVVVKFKQETVKLLNQLEQKAFSELDGKYALIKSRIDTDIRQLEDTISILNKTLGKMDTSKNRNETKLFTCMKAGKIEFESFEKSLDDMETSICGESLNISINKTIEDFIQTVKTMGEIQDEPLYRVESPVIHGVKTSSDSGTCGITHMCQLEDGTILLVDSLNQSLKRLDGSYNVCETLTLPSKPVTACTTDRNQVAIALVELKEIQFVTTEDKMALGNKFSVNEFCRGVACHGDKIFVSCGGGFRSSEGSGQVRLYTKDGEMLACTEISNDVECKFTMPLGMTVSRYNTRVYVADRDNGLIILDRHGKYLANYKDSVEGTTVTAVCVGNRNELFVCGIGSNCITQLDRNGQQRSVYILNDTGDINYLQALLFDKMTGNVLVARQGSNNVVALKLTLTEGSGNHGSPGSV